MQSWGHLVGTYAVGHGLFEFACALQVAWLATGSGHAATMILAYNACAFGSPLLLATLVPSLSRRPWPASTGQLAMIGSLVAVGGTMAAGLAPLSIILLGLGNGAYHLAAGTATLRLPHRPVAAVGLFEGPGALGRVSGLVLGMGALATSNRGPWLWALAALFLAIGLFTIKPGTLSVWRPPMPTGALMPHLGFVLLGLAALSVLRGMSGDVVTPAPDTGSTLMLAGLMICLGRCAGGLLAETFGLTNVIIYGFIGTGLLFVLNPTTTWVMAAALFTLGVPMAPILGALALHLKGQEPVAFGLAQVFQLAGATLAVTGMNHLWLVAVAAGCALLAPWLLRLISPYSAPTRVHPTPVDGGWPATSK